MSELIADLREQGIPVSLDQGGEALPSDAELLVYSEAIPPDAPERRKATSLGIPQKSYPEALAEIQDGSRTIAVCGTHGKSSTTAMAARVLLEAGLDPTVVVGTKVRELGGRNWRQGKSGLFLVEACEYRRSFMHYSPSIVILTNCDGDHFDYYASEDDYKQAFVAFIQKLPKDGMVITHKSDRDCADVVQRAGRTVQDADSFPLTSLNTPGLHMMQNAQLVLALAEVLSIPHAEATKSLSGFAGTWRRMEVKGEAGGVLIVDDYAHHPKEITATIAAMKSAYPSRRLVTVFQPHTHDRTLKMYEGFTKAFAGADSVIIPDIYVARTDIETKEVDVDAFVKDIASRSSVEARNGTSLKETERMLRKILKPGDILLCMGAGNITSLAARMLDLHTQT